MRKLIKKILKEGKEEFTEEDLNNFMSMDWPNHKEEVLQIIKNNLTTEVKDKFESGKGIINQFIDIEKIQSQAIDIVTQNITKLVDLLLKCNNEGVEQFLKDLIIKLKPLITKELNEMNKLQR